MEPEGFFVGVFLLLLIPYSRWEKRTFYFLREKQVRLRLSINTEQISLEKYILGYVFLSQQILFALLKMFNLGSKYR